MVKRKNIETKVTVFNNCTADIQSTLDNLAVKRPAKNHFFVASTILPQTDAKRSYKHKSDSAQ